MARALAQVSKWIDRSGIAYRPGPAPYSGPQLTVGDGRRWSLSRCRRPALGRQDDQAGIVGPTLYEPDLLGVADRLFEVRTHKPDVLPDVLRTPPGLRALGTQSVKLGNQRRRTLKSVAGDRQPVSSQEKEQQQARNKDDQGKHQSVQNFNSAFVLLLGLPRVVHTFVDHTALTKPRAIVGSTFVRPLLSRACVTLR
jgi:hypothetical protein